MSIVEGIARVQAAVVYIVDDDEALRRSLGRLLEEVNLGAESYASVGEFLAAYDSARPSCAVLDVRMPGMSGMDLQRKLMEEGIEIPVIIVTGHGDITMAVEAMRCGAVDFLEKPYRPQDLLDGIHRALIQDAERRVREGYAREIVDRFGQLTAREREVVDMVADGMTNKQIAEDLGVTPQAIDARRSRAMAKLGVATVPQLVEAVIRHTWAQKGTVLPPLASLRSS
jgi:RNA polymerase sigma factor (sigma-70 family)